MGTAVAVEAVGGHLHGYDFDGHPIARINALDKKRAARTRIAFVGGRIHDHSRPDFAGCFVIVIVASGSFDDHGFAQFERPPDFDDLGVGRSAVIRCSGKAAHNACAFRFCVEF